MEIDFMGLYSQTPPPGPPLHAYDPHALLDSGIAGGQGDVSLSLCTSSRMDGNAAFQDFLRADRKMYASGDASFDNTRKSKGHTPTVAMARKATLARFLEKRWHRLNQQIKPHVIGRSLNWPEVCHATNFTKCNKKIKSSMEHEVLM